MDSGYWQSQFEDWLRHHHRNRMPPMTSSIFVVFGQPRKRSGKTVLSTGWWCYRHVISMTSSARRKIIRSGIVLPFWRRQKPGVFFCGIFLTFRQKNWRAFVMLSKRIASAQKLRLPRQRQKSYRMQTGWRRWAPLVWRGSSRSPARWASRCLMPTIPLPTDGLLTISNSRSTILKPNC